MALYPVDLRFPVFPTQRYDRPLLRLPTQLILSLGAMLSASSSHSAWLLPTPLGGSGTPRAVMWLPVRLRGGYRLEGLPDARLPETVMRLPECDRVAVGATGTTTGGCDGGGRIVLALLRRLRAET